MKAVVLLLLIHCLLLLAFCGDSVFGPCLVIQYFVIQYFVMLPTLEKVEEAY